MNDPDPPARIAPLRLVIATVLAFALAAAIVWGYLEGRSEAAREAEGEQAIKDPVRVSTADGQPVVTLDAATRERTGIVTAAVAAAPYQPQWSAYGAVLDLTRYTDLRNRYANAGAQLQTAQAKLAASRTAYERARQLYEDQQNVSLAQFQAAQATFRVDEASVEAARSQVRTLAATANQEWGPALGSAVVGDAPLAKDLIERRLFLVQVSLAPGKSLVQAPRRATVRVGESAHFTAFYVSPATRVDPKIQGASFFYTLPAHSGVLPGMNVVVDLAHGEPRVAARVPADALVWWQDRAWVYRRTADDKYARVEIPTVMPAGNGGYIAPSLGAGAQIVVRGAQSLLSEEFRAQIQVGD